VAKSSISSPIQETLTNALKITENHSGRVTMHQLFTSTQKKTALQAVDNKNLNDEISHANAILQYL